MSTTRARRGLVAGFVALALAAAGGGYAYVHSLGTSDAGHTTAARPTTGAAPSPVLNPDGTLATDTARPTFVATDPPQTATAPPTRGASPHTVEVVQTYASFDKTTGVTAGGFVAQTVEDGGSCTLTLTGDGTTVKVDAPATPDASSTACGALTVPPGKVSSGRWTSVISYSSATSEGTSPSMQVVVP